MSQQRSSARRRPSHDPALKQIRRSSSTRRALPPLRTSSISPLRGCFSIIETAAAIVLVLITFMVYKSWYSVSNFSSFESVASSSDTAANVGRHGCGVVGTSSYVDSRLEESLNQLLLDSPSQPFANYILETDRKRLRQETDGGGTRALSMHFAGSGSASEKHRAALNIADSLFVSGTRNSLLDIDCAAETAKVERGGVAEEVLDALKDRVLEAIQHCPKTVVVLQNIQDLPILFGKFPGIVVFEQLFEESFAERDSIAVDLRNAIFILTSNTGAQALRSQGITARSFYERQPTEDASQITSQVNRIINDAVGKWLSRSRPALGGRLSNSVVPFV